MRAAPVVLLAALAGMFAVRAAGPVLVPVLIAVLLAYALEPIVATLVRWHTPRALAAVGVFCVAGLLAGGIGRGIRDQVTGFLADLPATIASLTRSPDGTTTQAGGSDPGILGTIQQTAEAIQHVAAPPQLPGVTSVALARHPFDVTSYLLGATHGILSTGVQLLVVALLTFLLLASGDLYKRKLVNAAGPQWSDKRLTVDVIRTIDRQIERYLIVRLLISGIVAVGTAVPLWLLGVNRALMWGVVAGALNVLPFIGPGVACALIALAAFVQFGTVGMAAAAGGAAAIVAAFEGNVISPWLTSRAGELNTVAVFVSVLFWGWMWDVWGLLLAVPIMVAVKAAADRIEPLQPLGELLGR